MRPELQRIETALAQLEKNPQAQNGRQNWGRNRGQTLRSVPRYSTSPTPQPQSSRNFEEGARPISSSFALASRISSPTVSSPQSPAPLPQTAPTLPQPYQSKLSTLPKLQSAQISKHRHGVNPALATNLLKEIEEITMGWQQELKSVLIAIQDLYLEGPIVDGWLESQSPLPDRELSPAQSLALEQSGYNASRPGYRLCGLDESGRLWSRSCPPEQVASVSVAIARFQKLRQLLKRKQSLENRLSNLAESLVMVHGKLKEEV